MNPPRTHDPLRRLQVVLAWCSALLMATYFGALMFAYGATGVAGLARDLALAGSITALVHAGLVAALLAEGRSLAARAFAALLMAPPSILVAERAVNVLRGGLIGGDLENLVWLVACAAHAVAWCRLPGLSLPGRDGPSLARGA